MPINCMFCIYKVGIEYEVHIKTILLGLANHFTMENEIYK